MQPPEWVIANCFEAGGDATEREIVAALKNRIDAGYAHNSKNGPRSWKWFQVTIRNHFEEIRRASLPPMAALADEELLRMSAVFDPASDDDE